MVPLRLNFIPFAHCYCPPFECFAFIQQKIFSKKLAPFCFCSIHSFIQQMTVEVVTLGSVSNTSTSLPQGEPINHNEHVYIPPLQPDGNYDSASRKRKQLDLPQGDEQGDSKRQSIHRMLDAPTHNSNATGGGASSSKQS
eukprot:c9752_g1_i2.p1 GENE.c9752_g1_i2~~c9752_g1_i2.p1  ORF type:complete len:140 (+),score=30.42 c9752_g1_i2:161-580(+)